VRDVTSDEKENGIENQQSCELAKKKHTYSILLTETPKKRSEKIKPNSFMSTIYQKKQRCETNPSSTSPTAHSHSNATATPPSKTPTNAPQSKSKTPASSSETLHPKP
jgi:hypothetical protein